MMKMNGSTYKIEDMILLNMKMNKVSGVSLYRSGYADVFEVEDNMNQEEKIAFIDEVDGGMGTYIFSLLTKWSNEKDGLPQTDSNHNPKPKTVSAKAWFRRNDPKGIVRIQTHRYPRFYYYYKGTEFGELTLVCPRTVSRSYSMLYTGKDIVSQWFHDLLLSLKREEKKYFMEYNPVQVKINKVKEFSLHHSETFGIVELGDIAWNNLRDVPEEDLDKYIEAFEKLEVAIAEIGKGLPGTKVPDVD